MRSENAEHLDFPEWVYTESRDPEFFRAYAALRSHVFGDGSELPAKYRELIHVCLLASRLGPDRALRAHILRAKEAGASQLEILEALETAMIAAGVPAYIHGVRVLMEEDADAADPSPRRSASSGEEGRAGQG